MKLTNEDIEQIKTWIAALRSGEYKQSKHRLETQGGYCCLGVACKVVIPIDKLELNQYGLINGEYSDEQTYAPEWLKKINSDTEFWKTYGESLAGLNDSKGYSFEAIAQIIEDFYINNRK